MEPALTTAKPRLDWVDAVKGLGMLLMYYGHVLQSLPDHASAVAQLKLIYSFHMPLFFVLAGFFFRPTARPMQRVWQLATRRLLPVLFFGVLLLPLWMLLSVHHHQPWWQAALQRGAQYLHGGPELDWVTWFLICLFVCELMALLVLPRIKHLLAVQLTFGLACIWIGVQLCGHPKALHGWVGHVGSDWFIAEAIVGLGFYAIGHALYPLAPKLLAHRPLTAVLGVLAAIGVFATYRLNHPDDAVGAVMMAAEQHGFVLDFAFTALAGTLAMVVLGVLLPSPRWLLAIGRNTLPLLGLAGVFFHFVNPQLAEVWRLADSPTAVTIYALVIAAGSLVVCVPLVVAMNRWVPQLIGKSQLAGPWLPSLEAWPLRKPRPTAL